MKITSANPPPRDETNASDLSFVPHRSPPSSTSWNPPCSLASPTACGSSASPPPPTPCESRHPRFRQPLLPCVRWRASERFLHSRCLTFFPHGLSRPAGLPWRRRRTRCSCSGSCSRCWAPGTPSRLACPPGTRYSPLPWRSPTTARLVPPVCPRFANMRAHGVSLPLIDLRAR